MGQLFHHTQIGEGLIIKIEGEGFAELLEAVDEGLTEISDEADGICIKQRWLIKWVDIAKIPGSSLLNPAERITQITLKGRKTHRTIVYLSDRRQDPYTLDNNSYDKESDFDMNDDFNGMY